MPLTTEQKENVRDAIEIAKALIISSPGQYNFENIQDVLEKSYKTVDQFKKKLISEKILGKKLVNPQSI